jgi:hypothetical protein
MIALSRHAGQWIISTFRYIGVGAVLAVGHNSGDSKVDAAMEPSI